MNSSLSLLETRGLCLAAAGSYVASVYIGRAARGPRDAGPTMVRRMINVSAVSFAWVLWAASWLGGEAFMTDSWSERLARVGLALTPKAGRQCLMAAALTSTLFCGPLMARICGHQQTHRASTWLQNLRDYIIGPLTEEIVFRGVAGALLTNAGATGLQTASEPALLFAFAHVHHIVALKRSGASWGMAIVSTTIHASMTYVFGLYAGFLLVQTGSAWPGFVAHALANYAGPPELGRGGWYRILLLLGILGFAYGCGFLIRVSS